MKRAVPSVAVLLWLLCSAAPEGFAQGEATVSGVIRDVHGTPQMGALIELLSGDLVVARTFSDLHGHYQLQAAQPGHYGVRASSTLALPAQRSDLHLQTGISVLANFTMSAIYEVGILFPAEQRGREESPNDWRWTLRSSANRPLLRMQEDGQEADSADGEHVSEGGAAFDSHTQLASSFRTGDLGGDGVHQELSTEHARKIGIMGSAVSTISADFGESASGAGADASISLRSGLTFASSPGSASEISAEFASEPSLAAESTNGTQVLTLAVGKQIMLGDAAMLDAGTLLLSERLNGQRSQEEPYLRFSISPKAGLTLMYRFATDTAFQGGEDAQDRISPKILADAEGRPVLPHRLHQEFSASHSAGSDTETLAVYHDDLPSEGLEGFGQFALGELSGLPILVDGSSGRYRLTVPGYTAHGITASWTHRFGSATSAMAVAEYGTALLENEPATVDLGYLRDAAHAGSAPALMARAQATVAPTRTALRVQYRWQPRSTLDLVDTFNADQRAFLSLSAKQRLWASHLASVEAVVDADNLLEQGYKPVIGPNGEVLLVAPETRTLQAGLSFTF